MRMVTYIKFRRLHSRAAFATASCMSSALSGEAADRGTWSEEPVGWRKSAASIAWILAVVSRGREVQDAALVVLHFLAPERVAGTPSRRTVLPKVTKAPPTSEPRSRAISRSKLHCRGRRASAFV